MEDLILFVLIAVWIPIGYLAARTINAWDGIFNFTYEGFNWHNPASNIIAFESGVLLGWITFAILASYTMIVLVMTVSVLAVFALGDVLSFMSSKSLLPRKAS
jgi:VIT1/CCC1 family predicted Fe2+/Mn2+ transporter